MRNDSWIAISILIVGAGNVIGCSIDDSVSTTTHGGAAGMTTAGGGGNGSTTASTTAATGGRGGAAGSVGGAGAGGNAGSGGAGGATDAAPETGTDGEPDAGEPDAVEDAGPEVEACAPESDGAFCARLQKNCGTFIALDNCGIARTAGCPLCAAGLTCGGGGTLNVCPGTGPVNRAQGGQVDSTNPSNPPAFAAEDMFKVFDNSILTKWFVPGHAGPLWIRYQFAGGATYAITSYTVTAANDSPQRDPRSWELQGSNNGVDWVTVDAQSNQIFDLRFQTNTYSFTNATAYPVYRFNVLDPAGIDFQVGEIQLFGAPGPTLDAPLDVSND